MKENAYFTVEAALVLPIVMSALILTVFLFVFQYDRCLLEQDVNMLAVYAGTVTAGSRNALETAVRERATGILADKYAAWKAEELQVVVTGDKVSVRGRGSLTLPVPEWNLFGDENTWSAGIHRETRRISPADFIRLYRKIKGGNKVADGICEEP